MRFFYKGVPSEIEMHCQAECLTPDFCVLPGRIFRVSARPMLQGSHREVRRRVLAARPGAGNRRWYLFDASLRFLKYSRRLVVSPHLDDETQVLRWRATRRDLRRGVSLVPNLPDTAVDCRRKTSRIYCENHAESDGRIGWAVSFTDVLNCRRICTVALPVSRVSNAVAEYRRKTSLVPAVV